MVKNSQKHTVRTYIVIVAVVLVSVLSISGFIFWKNFASTENKEAETVKVVNTEQIETPVEQTLKTNVDKQGYSFTVIDGFNSSSTQMFEYTASLKAQATYVNDNGDYFEILVPYGDGGGFSADYLWVYDKASTPLSVIKLDRCSGEEFACTADNGTVEGIISDKNGETAYYLAFGNKTKNETNLAFVDKFLSTFQFK